MNNTLATTHNTPTTKRIYFLDELRGLAVVAMVLYHTIYSMAFIGDFPLGYNLLHAVYPYSWLISVVFISICGICSVFSKNNLKNGIKLLGIGLVITLVTAIFLPTNFIAFGVLHFLGCALIIIALLKKQFSQVQSLKVISLIIILCLAVYTISYNIPRGYIGLSSQHCITLPQQLYSWYPLFIVGLPTDTFYSADYFPIFPHLFLFIAGFFAGQLITKIQLPSFMYKKRCNPLRVIGKHSLIIYILHQPIIIGVIYIIKTFFL